MNNTIRLRLRELVVCLLGVALLTSSAVAQTRTITGTVTDKESGTKLAGVRIVAKGTRAGGVTDGKGSFKIDVPETAETLVFTYVGFAKKEIAIAGQPVINAALEIDARALEDVVVTAFGIEREKKALGYSVQEVSASDITKAKEPNVINALQGKVAGVNIINSSGAPGAGASMLIRGVTSLSPGRSNQPLFVIDGIPVSNESAAGNVLPSSGSNASSVGNPSSEQFSTRNRIGDINPDDIESISILKGPAATALYGSRAGNGVVTIKTKRGVAGKTLITFNSSYGIDELGKSPTLQSKWSQGRRGEAIDPSMALAFWDLGPTRALSGDPFLDNTRRLFDVGSRFDNSLTVTGGNEITKFFVSLGRFDQKAIIPFSEYQRTNLSLRGETKLSDGFSISASAQFTNSGGKSPSNGDRSIYSAASFWSSSFDVRKGYGTNNLVREGEIDANTYTSGTITHPLYMARMSPLIDDVNRLIGDVTLNYNPTDWLNVRYQITLDTYGDHRTRIVPGDVDLGLTVNGYRVEENRYFRELNSQLFVTAKYNFTDDIKGSLMLGNHVTDIKLDGNSVRGETFSQPSSFELSNLTNFFGSPIFSQRRYFSLFYRGELSYKDAVFFEFAGRNEQSSTLPKDNNTFFYPSFNLSAVISDLVELPQDIISFAKVRGSWAQAGKDADVYSIGEYYTSFGVPFSGQNGFRLSTLTGDRNLKPEIATALEFGAEVRFFNDRLSLDFTWFTNQVDNQIVNSPVSLATGFSTFTRNAGTIVNTGVELVLNATPLQIDNFRWDISANWSTFKGKVTKMPDGVDEIIIEDQGLGISKLKLNGAPGDLYGYDFIREKTTGKILIEADGLPRVTDATASNQVLVGNAFPDWLGGITNTFSWNGLALSFLWEFRQGGMAMDLAERNRYRNGLSAWTDLRHTNVVWNGVTANGQPNTTPNNTDPEVVYRATRINNAYQFQFQSTSWIRLRNASITYALPAAWLEGSPFKGVRLSLTGNNIWVTTPFRGYDPEGAAFGSGSNSFGFVGRTTPAVRSVNFGLNLTF